MADNSNRNINICLIDTKKIIPEFEEDNTNPIDHRDNFIWFPSKGDLDNYMALKTVFSQLQNSKQHNYRDIKEFRLKLTFNEFTKLDPDLLKINFKDNPDVKYYYNIEDTYFANNEVVLVKVSLNLIYTDFFSMKIKQISGVMQKTNFKNVNYDMAYVNEYSKTILRDNYDSFNYKGVRRKTFFPKEYPKIIFLAISCRKKPNIIDSSLGEPIIPPFSQDNMSDEFSWYIPFRYSDLNIADHVSTGYLTLAKISYLMLNGCLKIDKNKGIFKQLVGMYQYLSSAKFGFSSFFDIQDISIIDDCPIQYSKNEDGTISFPSEYTRILHLEDPNDEKEYTLQVLETFKSTGARKKPNKREIMSNEGKKAIINASGFKNWENVILYNSFYVKHFGYISQINSASLFGSKDALALYTYFLSKDYKKLVVSTEEEAHEDIIDEVWFNGRPNVDYGVKFNGQVQSGQTIGDMKEKTILGAVDFVGNIISGAAKSVPVVGGAIGAITDSVGDSLNSMSDITKPLKARGGGVSGYSQGDITSPWIKFHNELITFLICEFNLNNKHIDEMTSQYGTSCNFYTNDVLSHLNKTITNRLDNRCTIKGDFNVRIKYPQISKMLKEILARGVRFENKFVAFQPWK